MRNGEGLPKVAILAWQERIGSSVVLAIFDRELWEAALQAGLIAWPEEWPPDDQG